MMRLTRIGGLVALAALTAMAFIGVSSASALSTTLCTVDTAELTCPVEANRASHVHFETQKLDANGNLVPAKEKFLTGVFGITVECVALFLGDVQNAGRLGTPLSIAVKFTYSSCLAGCEIKETSSGSTMHFERTLTELGEVTILGLTILVKCGESLHCVYKSEGLVGHALGPLTPTHNGHITYTEAVVTKDAGGFLCPATTKLDALFLSLTPLYIRS